MLPINSPLRMLTGRPPRPHGHRPHGRIGVFVVRVRVESSLSVVEFFLAYLGPCASQRPLSGQIGTAASQDVAGT
jgi:hypothetical protein